MKPSINNSILAPSGLLNSNYKSVVKENLENSKSPSVFNVKRRVKSLRFNNFSGVDTVLKLSVFFVAFLIAVY